MNRASITILNGGTQTLLMDAGRHGHRHTGIPGGGAADKLSFAIANHLVGNSWDAPALEIALGGLHVRFEKDSVIALSGAEMWAQINGMNVATNRAVKVESGDILTLSFTRAGCRTYLAIAGGFEGTSFMGSVSTYLPAALGGLEGRALRTGDTLQTGAPQGDPHAISATYIPTLSNHIVLRARSGPELEYISAASRRYLYTTPFYATAQTDRMGSRLKGDKIVTDAPLSMTSSPLLPGSLQCPPDGQPILALADGHCTGGYPRALQIIQADLWLLGQIAPGTAVSFRRCFVDEAPAVLTARNAWYSSIIPGFTF